MTVLRLWLIIGALLAGALFVACGGDDDGDDTGDGEEPTATTSVEGGETPSDGDGGDDGDDGGDIDAELSDLASQFVSKPLKATYNYSSSSGGQTTEGALTVYTNPPDSWRLDIALDGSNSILIKNADGSFICDDSGGEGQCIVSPIGATIPLPFFGFLNDPGTFADTITGSFAGVDVDRSDVTIAGQDGKCYAVTSSISGAESTTEYCFTDDGLLLRAKVSAGGGEFSIEATSIETTVDPADLQPPYPVSTVPGQ